MWVVTVAGCVMQSGQYGVHVSHRGEVTGAVAKEHTPDTVSTTVGGQGLRFLARMGARGLTWPRAHLGPELGPN